MKQGSVQFETTVSRNLSSFTTYSQNIAHNLPKHFEQQWFRTSFTTTQEDACRCKAMSNSLEFWWLQVTKVVQSSFGVTYFTYVTRPPWACWQPTHVQPQKDSHARGLRPCQLVSNMIRFRSSKKKLKWYNVVQVCTSRKRLAEKDCINNPHKNSMKLNYMENA